MLPTDANWLSADSALWAAWLAGAGVIVTGVGVGVAYNALTWAKKAAEETAKAADEAGKQAAAAMASVDVAREQISLMKKELEWNEPQPILILEVFFSTPSHGPEASIQIKNVGDSPAFDIQLEPISINELPPNAGIAAQMRFRRSPFLAKGGDQNIAPLSPEMFAQSRDPMFKKYTDQTGIFVKLLIDTTTQIACDPLRPSEAGNLTVSFSNSRGATFVQKFQMVVSASRQLEVQPVGSLVRDRVKTNSAAEAKRIILTNKGY